MNRHRPTDLTTAEDPTRDGGGFAALELAILFPFVTVMLLLVVAFGRVERGRELVDQAAQAASRAGSLTTTPGAAHDAAVQAVQQALTDGGLSCSDVQVSVNTAAFRPGGQVDVRVSCTAELSGLTLSGVPGRVDLKADSVSPLEPYRPLTTGTNP